MNVAYSKEELELYLSLASTISPLHPVVITKFILNAMEVDVDAVARDGEIILLAVSEHLENAGVHSGTRPLLSLFFS